MVDSPLLVPLQLEAFRLNEAACGTGESTDHSARIAPISQPNYTFLRLDNFVIQNDVLSHTDLHNTAPASINPRLRDLGTLPTTPHRHRQGIYLHWTLPRCYRSGVSIADSVPQQRSADERLRRGLSTPRAEDIKEAQKVGSSTPGFLQPPTRWLVIRKIDKDSIVPIKAKDSFKEYMAWVIESDHLWKLGQIPLTSDLQVDVSPFVTNTDSNSSDINIRQQAEVFIGRKTPLDQWTDDPSQAHPDISLIRSSNELFADYQLHNSNVFSMADNFEYKDGEGLKYLEQAKASYYVLGWHWNNETDPFWNITSSDQRTARLEGLFMSFPGQVRSKDEEAWLKIQNGSRLLLHGAMYDVEWDVSKKPGNVPADDFARRLRDPTVPAMSVGTTPIDALITYCTARRSKGADPAAIEELEEDILAIESLLHARDDGVEGQREAKDTVYNWSYGRSAGGRRYYLAGDGEDGKPTDPNPDAKDAVTDINKLQMLHDSCQRALQRLRWDMFSRWWKYVSDARYERSNEKTNKEYRNDTDKLSKQISSLDTLTSKLEEVIDKKLHPEVDTDSQDLVSSTADNTARIASEGHEGSTVQETEPPKNPLKDAKTGTLPFYYRAQDPTVLVGGIDSGWALDYLDNVKVRLVTETIVAKDLPSGLESLVKQLTDTGSTSKMPAIFASAISALAAEFWALMPASGDSGSAPDGKYYPQFHDQNTADTPQIPASLTEDDAPSSPSTHASQLSASPRWRDRWSDRQPWFPLFVEWEVEYNHIPLEYWSLDERTARLSDNIQVRYGIDVPSKKPLYDELLGKRDRYVLSGRSLILPQPSFSLQAKVKQLFMDTPDKLLDLSERQKENLLERINELSLLSTPLSGLIDGLLTLVQGAHIKPENKVLTDTGTAEIKPIKAAEFKDAGLTLENIGLIDSNSALTPFATVTRFDDKNNCPFKPVTHGQFRFRKFNIIDKFGQALVAQDPKPTAGDPPPIYPAISDWYEPQMYDKSTANTVVKDEGSKCQFMQLPPTINQPSRLNANFIVSNAGDKDLPKPTLASWRPASEWETPIWGWIVVNYADYGIQFFLPSGEFYREVRIGGPLGSLVGAKWTPFQQDPSLVGENTTQLDALIKCMEDAAYLKGFWGMITMALDALPPAPSTYAEFLNAIVGKPLALVNIGWSLELDTPAMTNQSTNSAVENPNIPLLPKDPFKPFDPKDHSYSFTIKLGDKEREYDGLVGYFDTKPDQITEWDLMKLYTYFVPAESKSELTRLVREAQKSGELMVESEEPTPLVQIRAKHYPKFKPFYIQPFTQVADDKDPPIIDLDPKVYFDQRNRAMETSGKIISAIIDPFTAVHAYSSILPANALSLPSWTWQGALDKMTAFLHAGPFNITDDVLDYDEGRRLKTSNMKDLPPLDSVIRVPSLPAGDWNWLQPYLDPKEPADDASPAYNSYGLDRRGNPLSPGFQKTPYTALEGFLQLRKPIMQNADTKDV